MLDGLATFTSRLGVICARLKGALFAVEDFSDSEGSAVLGKVLFSMLNDKILGSDVCKSEAYTDMKRVEARKLGNPTLRSALICINY